MSKVIDVKDLCKTYVVNKKQNNVLRNVSFSIEDGEMVGIMGPSGSGKSTLLYTVSGMDRMTAGSVSFDGKELFHPLIENAVPNDIVSERGVLITGSNASGKSTFLKTCAINAIFAQSIHTVLGKGYKAPLYRIYSSMALKDDIFEGDSYYIVEIKSIKRILDAAAEKGCQVLCFVDEVLRGTNTVERIAASTQILKELSREKVQCFAATHDIELTSLLKEEYNIYHFEGDVTDNDVKFDYMIKSGPATTRNAIRLLSVLGYEKELVENAQKMADGFLEKGSWEAAF